jgi:hypothetical protein
MLSDFYALLHLRCALVIPTIIPVTLITVDFLQYEFRLSFVEGLVIG